MASNLPRPTAPRTSSRCTPQTARGTHAFEIAGCSLHRGRGVGSFVRSAAFDVGGYSWCIRFHPDGYIDGDEDSRDDGDGNGSVAAFLELLTQDAEVTAHYDFRLLDHVTGSSCSAYSTAVPQVFDTLDAKQDNYFAWGTDELMGRRELEENYQLDDCLVLECDVTVIMEPQVESTVTSSDDAEVLDLSSSFGKLLEMEDQADVVFKVEDEVFHAHKAVLAVRSPIFVAEPDVLMQDKVRECIVVQDMRPDDVFRAMLHFIYTDTMPAMEGLDGGEKEEIVRQLLVAADKYAMSRLKLICEDILSTSSLARADQHHGIRLKDAYDKYIVNSLGRVSGRKASPQHHNVKGSRADIFSYLLEKATKLGVFLFRMK